MARSTRPTAPDVETYVHPADKRRNIPTAENQGLVPDDEKAVKTLRWPRNPDLDPQLVWRGKDAEDGADLEAPAPPIYIQEKIHPKAIIADLKRRTAAGRPSGPQPDLFSDFNGLPDAEARTEFYAHDQNWSNRMILGDSLMVMASLAEREALRGKVQMIYLDPPYGIKFNSNWQPSTKSRDVKDGKLDSVSREPEVVRAFRDTWDDGIHSYLSYLRDRLTLSRELLSESGSVLLQIGEENLRIVRSLLDEVFLPENAIATIIFLKTSGATSEFIPGVYDAIVWYAKNKEHLKYRQPYRLKEVGGPGGSAYTRVMLDDGRVRPLNDDEKSDLRNLPAGARVHRIDNLTSQSVGREKGEGAASWFPVDFIGKVVRPSEKVRWKTNAGGMEHLKRAGRLSATDKGLYYIRFLDDFRAFPIDNVWPDTVIAGFTSDKQYVVETSTKVIERCVLMTTDSGDLVLDPTCGSGTTAYVAEQWGRRWITIDTSRVALALARTRIMAARYDWYQLRDTPEGAAEEARLAGRAPTAGPFGRDLRQGFVYERAPRVTLKSIANNAEIDVIWDRWQATLEPLRGRLNAALSQAWEEWQVPREAAEGWPAAALADHGAWWEARRARQGEIDASIARNAEVELLYDRPVKARGVVRVAGPFTVESLSPHRVLPLGEDPYVAGALADEDVAETPSADDGGGTPQTDFASVVYENLKAAGVQNTKKGGTIRFDWLRPFASKRGYIAFEGQYEEAGEARRAAIAIGPEYDTVGYDMVRNAAREAMDAFDTLIVCGFAFAPEIDESRLNFGRLTVLKARMNQDLRMADKLKATGAGNLFVVFGEPDIAVEEADSGEVRIRIRGVDIFDPTTGEVRSSADPADDIACWFIDDDYDQESFFVRQAYFLGRDPYESLKRALKAEIDEAAWSELNSTVSRAFPRPSSGRVCVKVINHFGDEVQKVFSV
ncbi:MAG TPA: site-specific DNA-methyltransferase [Caulobacteraceae bacterium]